MKDREPQSRLERFEERLGKDLGIDMDWVNDKVVQIVAEVNQLTYEKDFKTEKEASKFWDKEVDKWCSEIEDREEERFFKDGS